MKILISFLILVWISFFASGCGSDDDAFVAPVIPASDTIRVPADMPTIQAAVEAADSGQVILLGDGVYAGPGNRDIEFTRKQVILVSENGPAHTIIDCAGDSADPHGGLLFYRGSDNVTIDGLMIRGGYAAHGPAIFCTSSSPTIRNCILLANHATVSGGAVRCKSASPRFVNCTLVDNSTAMVGAAVHVIAGSSPVFENCIIAFSDGGGAVFSSDGTSVPQFNCSDIFGNEGGDWTDVIAGQLGLDGNFSSDPLFCDRAAGDFSLRQTSPCASDNNGCAVLIGALPVGCPD